MKFFCGFILTFFLIPNDLQKLRKEFRLLETSKKAITEIKSIVATTNQLSLPLKTAYFAVAEMTTAKYKVNPFSQISAFNSGKKLLEDAVRADSLNPEIIYIRYTIQTQAPGFLGYTKNISTDKKFLIKNLKAIKLKDEELYTTIYNYLIYKGAKTVNLNY